MINIPRNNLMKYLAVVTILIILVSGCAKNAVSVKSEPSRKLIHYSQLKTLDETAQIGDYIVYLNPGDAFPLEMKLLSEAIDLQPQTVTLIAKKKLYFKLQIPDHLNLKDVKRLEALNSGRIDELSVTEQQEIYNRFMLYISPDKQKWAPINDIAAIKDAFNLKGGAVSFGMSMNRENGLASYLRIQVNKKR